MIAIINLDIQLKNKIISQSRPLPTFPTKFTDKTSTKWSCFISQAHNYVHPPLPNTGTSPELTTGNAPSLVVQHLEAEQW